MAKIKKVSKKQVKTPVSFDTYPTQKQMNKLLSQTSDEEIGRAYRQRKEANEFLTVRGLY